MTLKPIRVGIIGMGSWGSRAHLPAFAGLPDAEVIAVVDPDLEAARGVAAQFNVPRIEADAERLLRDPDELDAIVIATPDGTHRDLAVAAFDAGLHVLCEKPLAYSVAEGEEMLEAAEQAGRIAKVGFLFRHSPVVMRMRELVDDGFIGDVKLFEHISVNAQFIDPQRPLHWKMQRRHAGGGVFVEYGTHTIDLALWFGGPLARVVAHGVTLVPERPLTSGDAAVVDVDDTASWIGEYASGGQALFRSGWASLPAGASGMRIYGTRGTLFWQQHGRASESLVATSLDDPRDRILFEFEPPDDPAINSGAFPLGILFCYNQRLVESFIADIRSGETTWPSFADGFAAQRVLAAIRTSLDEARWAEIEAG